MTVSKTRNSNQPLRGSRGTSRGLLDTSFAFVTDYKYRWKSLASASDQTKRAQFLLMIVNIDDCTVYAHCLYLVSYLHYVITLYILILCCVVCHGSACVLDENFEWYTLRYTLSR